MNVKKLLSVLVSLFCCINCMSILSYAEIDLTHTFVDERGLQENTWINLECIGKNEGCKKYLIRYEDAKKLEGIFKSLIKVGVKNFKFLCKIFFLYRFLLLVLILLYAYIKTS